MSPMALPFTQTQPLSSHLHFPNPITRVVSSSIDLPPPPPSPPPPSTGRREKRRDRIEMGVSSSTSSWRRALGQRFNREGAASFLGVAVTEPHLALSHLSVPDIRWVDWPAIRRLGFRGVVFDKDNTLTTPYSLALWPPLSPSLRLCQASFPGSVAVFSNSAGLKQYDPDGAEAKALEEAIEGIRVVKHGHFFPVFFLLNQLLHLVNQHGIHIKLLYEVKKPSGTAEDIERYFGCPASLLVMVGDRVFTDVVYGNKHGFLTILTDPFNLSGEPFIVKQVRKLERLLVNYWRKKGHQPPKHDLLAGAQRCIKVSPL
ncbi:phosphatidylglycerophosphate phosphatase 1, chloroplastic/mitochondrial isoform X1 [Zingiber officinale]|uniref:phosphatidylglycerophosphate phosphatase 1, chloroplastic/mitochondrial isoform X1 n=1 Tax=Zingiber officinale TaxID=94328 RepID=UPI001C4BC41E|nr:phosphatidylglycerophosphate phosphatase 1, chloroplastic/mitochondrial isoform X1 [Zingiber officinale]